MKKKLLILISITSIIFITGIISVYLVLPDEKIKNIVISIISQKLKRKVEISNISIGFFKFSLNDFYIKFKNSNENFISCKKIDVKLDPFTLFKRKLKINSLIIISPEINIKKYKNGNYNFSDLITNNKEEYQIVCFLTANISFAFSMNNIKVKNGIINYYDPNLKNYLHTETIQIKNINSFVSYIDKKIVSNGSFSFYKSKYNYKTTMDFKNKTSILNLKSNNIQLASLPINKADGKAKIDINISDIFKSLDVLGEIEFINSKFYMDHISDNIILNGSILLNNSTIKSKKLNLTILDNKLNINIKIPSYLKTKNIEITIPDQNIKLTKKIIFLINKYLPEVKKYFTKNAELKGNINISAHINVNLDKNEFLYNLNINKGNITAYLPQYYKYKIIINPTIEIKKDIISIKSLNIKTHNDSIVISGKITDFKTFNYDININSSPLMINKFKEFIPNEYKKIFNQYKPSGKIKIKLKIKGNFKKNKIDYNGNLNIINFNFKYPYLKKNLLIKNSTVVINNKNIKIPTTNLYILKNKITFNGKIENFKDIFINFSTNNFNSKDLPEIVELSNLKFKGLLNATGNLKGNLKKILLNGRINSKSLTIIFPKEKQPLIFPIKNLYLFYKFNFNDLKFNIDKIKFNIFNGNGTGNGIIDIAKSPVSYKFNINLVSAEVKDFLTLNTPLKKVTGKVSGKATFNGTGSDLEKLKGNLKYKISNGVIQSFPIFLKLSNLIAKFIKADSLKKLKYSNIIGKLYLENGKIKTDVTDLKSKYMDFKFKGEMDFLWNINLNSSLILKEEFIKNSKLSNILGKNKFEIPFNVKGYLMSPKIKLKISLNKIFSQSIKNVVKDKLLKIILENN